MTLSLGIFTFINVWWVTLFFVLPFGVTMSTTENALDYAAAPKAHKWKKLFLINSIISLVVTLCLAFMIHNGVVSLKNLVAD